MTTINEQQRGHDTRWRDALLVTIVGYAVMTLIMLGIGVLLTHVLDGSVGHWDEHGNRWLASHRTTGWNDVTSVAAAAFNTLPVIGAAAVVVAVLSLMRRWSEAVFLVGGLVLEITVFLSVTFVVARPRPAVVRLNSTPSTSSFPSGHTAAATVLLVGTAFIVLRCSRNTVARVVAVIVAVIGPCLVGFARVYRGLHHPSDVVVGAGFGLACLYVSAFAVRTASVDVHRGRADDEEEFERTVKAHPASSATRRAS